MSDRVTGAPALWLCQIAVAMARTLDRPRQRMSLYRTVLAEGQHDLVAVLNRNLLLAQWPVLRTLVSRHIRHVWEDAFPVLAGRTSVAA